MTLTSKTVATLVAGTLAGAPLARASESSGDDPRLGVLPAVVTGTESENVRPRAHRAVDGALDHAPFERASLDVERPPAANVYCADAQCWQWLAREHSVSHLLQITIGFHDPDWAIEAILVDGSEGRVLARVERTCDLCGFDELEVVVTDVAAGMRRKLEAAAASLPMLVVQSTPAGATVTIDGEPAGTTPLEIALEPGKHDVRVARDGFRTERRRVSVVDGVHNAVNVSLAPLVEPKQTRPERAHRLQVAGGVGVGVGLALLGVGVALLVLDDRPIARDCQDDNVDPDGNCKWLYDTLPGGAAATAVGGALAITGVTLLVVGTKRRSRTELQASPGGLRVRF